MSTRRATRGCFRRIALAWSAIGAVFGQPAFGQLAMPYRLVVDPDLGPDVCVNSLEFGRRVEARLGRAPQLVAEAAGVSLHVAFQRVLDGSSKWRGTLTIVLDDGRLGGVREVRSNDVSCEGIAQALVIMTALTLGHDACDDCRRIAGREPVQSAAVPNAEPARSVAVDVPSSRLRTELMLGAGIALEAGMLPRPQFGPSEAIYGCVGLCST